MMWRASFARSRAVTSCSGSWSPLALRNVEFVRPSSFARSFIRSAKAGSEPAIPSAMTIAASLPDCTISPRSSALSGTLEFELGEHRRPARGGAARPPGMLGDDELVVELERALLQAVKDVFDGHELGHRSGRHALVRRLLEEHRAAVEIDQDGARRLGIEDLRRRRRRRRARRAGRREPRPPPEGASSRNLSWSACAASNAAAAAESSRAARPRYWPKPDTDWNAMAMRASAS